MATENDNKIKALLQAIETKRTQLGTKPKAVWKTNGVITISGIPTNINTVTSVDKCAKLAASILMDTKYIKEACKFLGLEEASNEDHMAYNDMLDDLKLRVQMIKWDEEKKNLTHMESKLKDLRSVDLKTEDDLAKISKTLGI